jgi:peroxiredoxin
MTANLNQLPDDLPVPQDDGASDHLKGLNLPSLELMAINGDVVDLSKLKGRAVIYCYPMTGRPDRDLPEGWNQIPGARGCTPQSCSFRDHYQELKSLGVEVFGLSVQTSEYQQEMVQRLHLPFLVLSDENYLFQKALNLPTFIASGMTLLKRITLIVHDGVIEAVHYPIFPSDSDAPWVIQYLKKFGINGHV